MGIGARSEKAEVTTEVTLAQWSVNENEETWLYTKKALKDTGSYPHKFKRVRAEPWYYDIGKLVYIYLLQYSRFHTASTQMGPLSDTLAGIFFYKCDVVQTRILYSGFWSYLSPVPLAPLPTPPPLPPYLPLLPYFLTHLPSCPSCPCFTYPPVPCISCQPLPCAPASYPPFPSCAIAQL